MKKLPNQDKLDQLSKVLNNLVSRKRQELFKDIRQNCARYVCIMRYDGDVSQDADFQVVFNGFYQVRRNAEWRRHFYRLFHNYRLRSTKKSLSLEEILKALQKKTNRWEYSFSTKMLHTINPHNAIMDERVRALLELPKIKERDASTINEHYEQLQASVRYLQRKLKPLLDDFDLALPQLNKISTTKKVDFILWRYGAMQSK